MNHSTQASDFPGQSDTSAFAQTPARPVLGTGDWLHLLAPPMAVMAAAISFWHFVQYAFESNPVLNGLILAVMLWGCASFSLHLSLCFREQTAFCEGFNRLLSSPVDQEHSVNSRAYVNGMLCRLEVMGLGHHLPVHSSAMEPEFSALDNYFERQQEMSNFLVGLMVGLGLLGTFIGLLETLMATSDLIGKIAGSLSGGAEMESEFSKIVTGLQEPMRSMGTAFSASMFGLVGSIMLGFQSVVIRTRVSLLVRHIRRHVLSLASGQQASPDSTPFDAIFLRSIGDQLTNLLAENRLQTDELKVMAKTFRETTEALCELSAQATLSLQESLSARETILIELRQQSIALERLHLAAREQRLASLKQQVSNPDHSRS